MTTAPDAARPRHDAPRERVELILGQIEQLPTLPAVAMRLLSLTTSPDSDVADVVSVIKTDQSLTSKILSLVRRADLGVRGDVMTLERVVGLLGFEAVRNAVLSIQIYETFASVEPHEEADFDRTEFWKHSLAVACAAQLIAETMRPPGLSGEAFVCGLLHDIGKVALDACLPKSYARVVRATRQRNLCICDVERKVLGLDHTVAGKRLLTRWKLPKPIVESAWLHHQPPSALPASLQAGLLVRVVHLADILVRRQRIGFSGYQPIEPIDGLAGELGLEPDAVTGVTAKLGEQIEQHRQLVGLDRLTSTTLYAEALADANEELGRLNSSLAESNRRLSLRSRYFDTLQTFSDRLTLDDRVVDVCRSAAQCMADLVGVSRAAGFSVGGDGWLHAATAAKDGEPGEEIVSREPVADLTPAVLQAGAATNRIAAPPECVGAVCERFDRFFGGEPLWMLPFIHANTCLGGVLFAAPQDQVDRHNVAAAELEALSRAFGLAVATAMARTDAQRLNEELAEVNRQLHQAQAELLRARSLAMVAEMAAGAAHELNNPLAVISGRAQLLARHCPEDAQRRALEIIQEQCTRATQIVSELMEFAKPDPPRPVAVPLGPWAQEQRRQWLERSSLRPHQFGVRISDPNVSLCADPDQLEQIVEAVISNAIDATAGRDARLLINSTSTTSDDTAVVAVEDNGTGMEPHVMERAADPFFSHRPAGRGRGLGLSRAARLAEANGGRLWLESTPGQGTTVFIELPASLEQ